MDILSVGVTYFMQGLLLGAEQGPITWSFFSPLHSPVHLVVGLYVVPKIARRFRVY